jgi:hypothetical protein
MRDTGAKFSIAEAFKVGFHQAVENFGALIALLFTCLGSWLLGIGLGFAMMLMLISFISMGAFSKFLIMIISFAIMIAGSFFLYGLMSLATTKMCLDIDAHGHTNMEVLRWAMSHKKLLWRMIILNAVITILMCMGFLLLIIPGLMVEVVYSFAYMYLVEHDCSWQEAMRVSAQLTKGSRLQLLGFFLITGLLGSMGPLAFFTYPVGLCATVHIYRKLMAHRASQPS